MDDQQTYLLNGLLARQFNLGRIVRFRPVQRGRQAESFELFTAQEKEYLVQIYPAGYPGEHLEFIAGAINCLDENRFSVMPFIATRHGKFSAEGSQGGSMLVSLAPAGSALAREEYTIHDISQVGLRLAWMHRLLKEQLPEPEHATLPLQRLEQSGTVLEQPLAGLLRLPIAWGWVHGDVSLAAMLHDADHQLRVLMDWGLLHWGCPQEDLVDAFLALAVHDGAVDRARGAALLEAYGTLLPIKRVAWTPVVAWWCAQRLIHRDRRKLPANFDDQFLLAPERLATKIASCM